MKEYIEREKAVGIAHGYCHTTDGRCCGPDDVVELYEELKSIPSADVVEVKLLDDGTLIVTTDKYPNVTRVFVEDGKTSGSLFYAEEV